MSRIVLKVLVLITLTETTAKTAQSRFLIVLAAFSEL